MVIFSCIERKATQIVYSFLLLIFSSTSGYTAVKKPTVLLTIPKSGTWLLGKAINSITEESFFLLSATDLDTNQYIEDVLQKNHPLYCAHLTDDYDILSPLSSDELYIIIGIRDPRDIVLSQIDWMNEKLSWWLPIETILEFNNLPRDEKIKQAILMPDEHYGVHKFIQSAIKWSKHSSALICRYEDLVGPLGGGSRNQQINALTEIAKFLRRELTEQQIEEIADSLYGDSYTFRIGKMGRWRNEFSTEHMDLMNEILGEEMIELHYETSQINVITPEPLP